MSDDEFCDLMALVMCSDPWPEGVPSTLIHPLLDREAKKRGHDGWIVAYHEMRRGPNRAKWEEGHLREATYFQHSRELTVYFRNGSAYTYFDVPNTIGVGLVEATVPQHFYAEKLRGHFRYART